MVVVFKVQKNEIQQTEAYCNKPGEKWGDYGQDWNNGDSKKGLDSRCIIFSLTLLKCNLYTIKHAH